LYGHEIVANGLKIGCYDSSNWWQRETVAKALQLGAKASQMVAIQYT
jgi:hypothetical protein